MTTATATAKIVNNTFRTFERIADNLDRVYAALSESAVEVRDGFCSKLFVYADGSAVSFRVSSGDVVPLEEA